MGEGGRGLGFIENTITHLLSSLDLDILTASKIKIYSYLKKKTMFQRFYKPNNQHVTKGIKSL